MTRPSRVDADHALDAAMAVFWARGYAGASMEDLVAATGAARYGLYAAWGGKRGLYLAALDRYQTVIVNRLFAGVEAADASIGEIRGYFDGLLAMAASPQGRLGCLMVNTALEADEAFTPIVAAYRARLRDGFSAALARAHRRKQIARLASADDTAQGLVALAFGLWALARAGAYPTDLRAAANAGLSAL